LLATGTFDGCRGDGFLQAVLVLHPCAIQFAPVLWFTKFQCSLIWYHTCSFSRGLFTVQF